MARVLLVIGLLGSAIGLFIAGVGVTRESSPVVYFGLYMLMGFWVVGVGGGLAAKLLEDFRCGNP